MAKSAADVMDLLGDLELGYSLTPTKVLVKQELPAIQVGSIALPESHEGDTMEVPRWVAEVMGQMGFVEIEEEGLEIELFKALSREKIQGSTQLSTLKVDFYQKIRRELAMLKSKVERDRNLRQEYEKMAASAYDLIALRVSKVLQLAGSALPSSDLIGRLNPEERSLFSLVHHLVERWREALLESE